MKEIYIRKYNRLMDYDYSQGGVYFITICAKEKAALFGTITGEANFVRQKLSDIGIIIDNEIKGISNIYENVEIEAYVIMPNHIHMLIVLKSDGQTQFAPSISRIVKQFKGAITKRIGTSIWHKSFYDHIIRDEIDFIKYLQFLEADPANWLDDEYYVPNNNSES